MIDICGNDTANKNLVKNSFKNYILKINHIVKIEKDFITYDPYQQIADELNLSPKILVSTDAFNGISDPHILCDIEDVLAKNNGLSVTNTEYINSVISMYSVYGGWKEVISQENDLPEATYYGLSTLQMLNEPIPSKVKSQIRAWVVYQIAHPSSLDWRQLYFAYQLGRMLGVNFQPEPLKGKPIEHGMDPMYWLYMLNGKLQSDNIIVLNKEFPNSKDFNLLTIERIITAENTMETIPKSVLTRVNDYMTSCKKVDGGYSTVLSEGNSDIFGDYSALSLSTFDNVHIDKSKVIKSVKNLIDYSNGGIRPYPREHATLESTWYGVSVLSQNKLLGGNK